MKHLKLAIAVSCGLTAGCERAPETPGGTTYHVYFLAGQSNMEGYGFNSELPADLQSTREEVRIYTGNHVPDGEEGGGEGRWESLSPGFGKHFDTDGRSVDLSDRFGPELSFGVEMARRNPDRNIAIIKFTRGGSSLAQGIMGPRSWEPEFADGNRRNLYDQALTTISGALASQDIDGDGKTDTLVPSGIVWMQGESDAFRDRKAAQAYFDNLGDLMPLFRAALHDDELPVVIGRIADSGRKSGSPWMQYEGVVREAQARFVERDPCASLVTASDTFGFIDEWHYRSEDYVSLGSAFAKAMTELQASCKTLPG